MGNYIHVHVHFAGSTLVSIYTYVKTTGVHERACRCSRSYCMDCVYECPNSSPRVPLLASEESDMEVIAFTHCQHGLASIQWHRCIAICYSTVWTTVHYLLQCVYKPISILAHLLLVARLLPTENHDSLRCEQPPGLHVIQSLNAQDFGQYQASSAHVYTSDKTIRRLHVEDVSV